MPKLDHKNIGEVLETVYLPGVIKSLDIANDLCRVEVYGLSYSSTPIFYHCKATSTLRSNGAILGGSGAFAVDDNVIVQAKRSVNGFLSEVKVVGFPDGLHTCGYCISSMEEEKGLILPPYETAPLINITMANAVQQASWPPGYNGFVGAEPGGGVRLTFTPPPPSTNGPSVQALFSLPTLIPMQSYILELTLSYDASGFSGLPGGWSDQFCIMEGGWGGSGSFLFCRGPGFWDEHDCGSLIRTRFKHCTPVLVQNWSVYSCIAFGLVILFYPTYNAETKEYNYITTSQDIWLTLHSVKAYKVDIDLNVWRHSTRYAGGCI